MRAHFFSTPMNADVYADCRRRKPSDEIREGAVIAAETHTLLSAFIGVRSAFIGVSKDFGRRIQSVDATPLI